MGTPENVRVLAGGGIWIAPPGTTLPTDATTPLDAAFQELGCISEEGLTESKGRSTSDIFCGWDGGLVRRVSSQFELTYSFSLIETNPRSQKLHYGNYADDSGDGVIRINGDDMPHWALVIQQLDGDDAIRVVAADAQVTDQDDVASQTGDATAYGQTLTLYPSSAINGDNAIRYISYGAASS